MVRTFLLPLKNGFKLTHVLIGNYLLIEHTSAWAWADTEEAMAVLMAAGADTAEAVMVEVLECPDPQINAERNLHAFHFFCASKWCQDILISLLKNESNFILRNCEEKISKMLAFKLDFEKRNGG